MGVDAVVVGGGVVGAAVLHALARRGVRAALFEAAGLASGATGWSGGLLRVYDPDPVLAGLAREGVSAYDRFEDEVGASCGRVRAGLAYLGAPGCLPAMREAASSLGRPGWPLQVLTAAEAARELPCFEWSGTGGAVYEEMGGWADPTAATRAWVARAVELGACAREGEPVHEVLTAGGRVQGVRTRGGATAAPLVVLAAGAWSARLAPPGERLRLRTKRVQACVVERSPALDGHPAFVDGVTGLYGRPEGPGASLLGLPVDEWDLDPSLPAAVGDGFVERLCEVARRRLPGSEAAAARSRRPGFDAYTADGRGLLGFAPGSPGLLLATGWSGAGFKLAPAIAERAARLAVEHLERPVENSDLRGALAP
jgi:sarcosine oxidase, subunit beta